MTQRVLRADAGGLCTLTLNRPDKRNALDTEAFEALDAHLGALECATASVGCVVLRGAGECFCAGADLKGIGQPTGHPPAYKPQVIERLGRLPQPVIAAVHGICYTGGLELALACDFIVADASARFADTHGKWGLVGAWGMAERLPRRIGVPAAKRMMMTGSVVTAAAAESIGLVDLLAPAGTLEAVLEGFVRELLANSWHTNFAAKRMMLEADGLPLAQALARGHYRHPGHAPDQRERVAAFKRE